MYLDKKGELKLSLYLSGKEALNLNKKFKQKKVATEKHLARNYILGNVSGSKVSVCVKIHLFPYMCVYIF